MYLDEYPAKHCLSEKYNLLTKSTPNPLILIIFSSFFILPDSLNVRFDISTKIQLSSLHYPSHRLSKLGQIESETVEGPLKIDVKTNYVFSALIKAN